MHRRDVGAGAVVSMVKFSAESASALQRPATPMTGAEIELRRLNSLAILPRASMLFVIIAQEPAPYPSVAPAIARPIAFAPSSLAQQPRLRYVRLHNRRPT